MYRGQHFQPKNSVTLNSLCLEITINLDKAAQSDTIQLLKFKGLRFKFTNDAKVVTITLEFTNNNLSNTESIQSLNKAIGILSRMPISLKTADDIRKKYESLIDTHKIPHDMDKKQCNSYENDEGYTP